MHRRFNRGRVAVLALGIWISALASPAVAQSWSTTLGGSSTERLEAVTSIGSGVLAVGWTESAGAGARDGLVVALDGCGQLTWSVTLGGPSTDELFAAAAAADGGALVVGQREEATSGQQFWAVRLASDGSVLWQASLGGTDDDVLRAAAAVSDGWIVAGERGGASDQDAWVARLDDGGNVVWQVALAGAGDEFVAGVTADVHGGVTVAGSTDSSGAGFLDVWLARFDAAGMLVWQRTYGGALDDDARGLFSLAPSGFIVASASDSFGTGLYDAWVLWIDATGDVVRERSYGTIDDDEALSAWQDGAGFRVAGISIDPNDGDLDSWLLALDASGLVDYGRSYGGSGDDVIAAAHPADAAGSLLAGTSDSFGAGATDGWIVRAAADASLGDGCLLDSALVLTESATSAVSAVAALGVSSTSFVPSASAAFESPVGLSVLEICAVSPGEVSPVGAAQPLVFDDPATLRWADATVSCAETFNVYRGELAALAGGDAGSCHLAAVPNNSATLLGTPAAATGWTWLVTATADGVQGTAGSDSQGNTRPLSAVCP